MDNKKFFIILTIVLCLNFVIGTTALVLAAIPLVKQSSSTGTAQGQAVNQQNWRQQGTYGAGQQPKIWQPGGQQDKNQQPGGQQAAAPWFNRPQAGGQQAAGPQNDNKPQFGAQSNQRQFTKPQGNMPQFGAKDNQRQFTGPRSNTPQFGPRGNMPQFAGPRANMPQFGAWYGGYGCPHGFQRFGGPTPGGHWGRPHGMMAPFEGHWYGGPWMMPQR